MRRSECISCFIYLSIHWWAPWLVPQFGYCDQCSSHDGCVAISTINRLCSIGGHVRKWYNWIIWESFKEFFFFWGNFILISIAAAPIYIPSTSVSELSSSLPTFDGFCFFIGSHSDWGGKKECSFKLAFPWWLNVLIIKVFSDSWDQQEAFKGHNGLWEGDSEKCKETTWEVVLISYMTVSEKNMKTLER